MTGVQTCALPISAVVTLQSPVDDAALKKAVEDKDYKVLGIE